MRTKKAQTTKKRTTRTKRATAGKTAPKIDPGDARAVLVDILSGEATRLAQQAARVAYESVRLADAPSFMRIMVISELANLCGICSKFQIVPV